MASALCQFIIVRLSFDFLFRAVKSCEWQMAGTIIFLQWLDKARGCPWLHPSKAAWHHAHAYLALIQRVDSVCID